MNYLNSIDLWNDIYSHPDFNKNLNELRDLNVKISQIIPLYEALGSDIKETDFDNVKREIETEKESSEQKGIVNEPDKNEGKDNGGGDSEDEFEVNDDED